MKKYILLLAAGKGNRFNTKTPKQFVVVKGKPLLLHTFEAFLRWEHSAKFILVLSKPMVEQWHQICSSYKFKTNHQIVIGGSTRFQSVKNGLEHIPKEALVAIHDGVRPLLSKRLIKEGFSLAEKNGSAIPVIKISDSVREIKEDASKPVSRQNLRLVQTPQFFKSTLIKQAYQNATSDNFTDDASVLQQAGSIPFIFEGDPKNIKVTRPEDIEVIKIFLK